MCLSWFVCAHGWKQKRKMKACNEVNLRERNAITTIWLAIVVVQGRWKRYVKNECCVDEGSTCCTKLCHLFLDIGELVKL